MDPEPLVNEQIESGARFLARFHPYAPVRVAFWLRKVENGRWCLYVASDRLTDETLRDGYEEVIRLERELQDPNLGPFKVKLIKREDPLVDAILKIQQSRYGGKAPIRLRETPAGSRYIEEAYIYPADTPLVAAEKRPLSITVVSDIRREGDTLVIKRNTIPLPPGTTLGPSWTETIPAPPGTTGVRYEDG